jgi:Ca-activated chloride channel family protein
MNSPRCFPRVCLALAGLSASAVIAALLATPVAGQGTGQTLPTIVFETPQDDSVTSGPTVIRIRLDPALVEVRNVSLFADGRLICTVERPPFACPWDAGPSVVEHVLRATVNLVDGRRVARSIRTTGVAYTETVDVEVVQVTATVTGDHGRFIRGLPRDAFRVYEDGVRQTITSFAAEDTPLELVVAVDFSGSMTDAMPTVKAAIKKFLSSLRPADRVTILGFNDNVFTVAAPTADLAARLKAIERLAPWGGTALYDVLIRSVGQLGQQAGRRAFVLFSDGEDLHSKASLEAAERRLESSDAVLYAIGQGRAPGMKSLRRVLERLSDKSGGRAFFEDLDGLDAVFREIVTDLSNQYLIGYVPQDNRRDNRWRELRIEIPGKDYRIRARKGYRHAVK